MELTKEQMEWVIFALNREIDLERMSDEEILNFAKEECGIDTSYIISLQEIVDLFKTYLNGGEKK